MPLGTRGVNDLLVLVAELRDEVVGEGRARYHAGDLPHKELALLAHLAIHNDSLEERVRNGRK